MTFASSSHGPAGEPFARETGAWLAWPVLPHDRVAAQPASDPPVEDDDDDDDDFLRKRDVQVDDDDDEDGDTEDDEDEDDEDDEDTMWARAPRIVSGLRSCA